MKKKPTIYLIIAGAVVAILCAILYFIHPLAPVMLLASLVIQIPIIFGITRATMNQGYEDRAYARRMQYQEDGDAEGWLAAEEQEARSVGFKYWSSRGKSLSAMNRAQPLLALGRREEAAALLAEVNENQLDKHNRQRCEELVAETLQTAPGQTSAQL